MKLLTLNTHSLIEENYPAKLREFVKMIAAEMPDIIALQEVNQSMDSSTVDTAILSGYWPCTDTVIREDNHVYNMVRLLAEAGVSYRWTWLPVKIGYGRYDEGLALLSLHPILETDTATVSRTDDYTDWRTRKIVGIRTEKKPDEWFYSVHYSWWNDSAEPFEPQWQKTLSHLKKNAGIWLMGDFNNPAEVRGEGYDLVQASGWRDSYTEAFVKDDGITVNHRIAGWEDHKDGIRIDQMWHSHPVSVTRSFVICSGAWYPVVSDHFGVMVEYNEGCENV
ncbi:MAG: endonuclease/exonuclease/phosphatase family protein [Clostridia bacterium]|nr:endonuclease/exonuclease/phosphatase family protein [Clostridia bacterium]